MTVAEVAALLRLSKMTVYRMAYSGDLAAVRVGRSIRIPEDAVLKLIADGLADMRQARLAAIDLVRELVDPSECAPDADGHCPQHGWAGDGPCPQARARDLLAEVDGQAA
ncbi:excisionase family DNA-binding protein [Herbidospora sp. NEAU-GS84]|uniref:Excisionase family DNA-binding protein n=1 Tax=Herbidospora solisilvae TaxID=2696284 RepID=A0A7C9N0S7_9ACTN|nr:excisionase family DNA-binding protein [Herbidospora solisilvae]